jgi:hypothetical protein
MAFTLKLVGIACENDIYARPRLDSIIKTIIETKKNNLLLRQSLLFCINQKNFIVLRKPVYDLLTTVIKSFKLGKPSVINNSDN